MSNAVRQLQSAFGKRTIERRRHDLPDPGDPVDDRMRYLGQLREFDDDFLSELGEIDMPVAVAPQLQILMDATQASRLLISSCISNRAGDFDTATGKISDLEPQLVSAFLDLLSALDPSSVSTARRRDED